LQNTPRRGISYPSSDRSDRPDPAIHIANVALATDVSVIYTQGTNAARLAAAHTVNGGAWWFETDTTNLYYDDGTNWWGPIGAANLANYQLRSEKNQNSGYAGLNPTGDLNIPGNLILAATKALSSLASAATSAVFLQSQISGDTFTRFSQTVDGRHNWGPGGAAAMDTNLYRSGVGQLRTDQAFVGNGTVPAGGVSGAALRKNSTTDYDVSWISPQGVELDYVQITSPSAAISATTEATATTFMTGNSITYDGTRVLIQFFFPKSLSGGGAPVIVVLRDSTVVGQIGVGSTTALMPYGGIFDTPSAGAHVYKLAAFVNTGSVTFSAGPGGSGQYVPGYLRVTKA
jgi:hypothetical protein